MTWLLHLGGRLRAFLRPAAFDRDLDQELESHLEMLAEEKKRRGMTPEQARRAARLELGGAEQLREAHREVRGLPLASAFLQDLRYAVRMLRRSPGFTATALAALALGIGASTAIFSIVNSVLLKPLPVFDPDRLVILVNTIATNNTNTASVSASPASPAKFAHWRAQSDVLQDVSAYLLGLVNYTGGEVTEQLESMQSSADFFRCMGVRIIQGRGFTAQEDLPGGPRVTLISQYLWQRRFASDPRILGKTISLSGDPYTVIGVVAHNPAWLELGPLPDVFMPFQLDPNSTAQGHYFTVLARLKPGVRLEQAQARLQASAQGYRARFPNAMGPRDGFSVTRYRDAVVGDIGPALLVLQGAVTLVLLIACADVANLLLVRASGRRREIAIRLAIGAGRRRIIRQLFTESVLLSLGGGLLGMLLGFLGIRALLAVNTAGLPRVGENGAAVGMDWRVLVFALAVSLATGLIFGLLPALQASRADLNSVLKSSSGRSGTGLRQSKTAAALVVSEVGLAVILLVGSALLIRTFVALYGVNLGFDPKNVITMRMSLTGPQYLTSMGVASSMQDGLKRIRALPGVVDASATCCAPVDRVYSMTFNIASHPAAPGRFTGVAGYSIVASRFFETLRIPVKNGRAFDDRDDNQSPAVAVISAAMARRFWNGGDPLKDRIAIGTEPPRQIIGIVDDIRQGALNREPIPTMYVPQAQVPDAFNTQNLRLSPVAWVVRARTDPHALVPAIREQLRQVTGLPVADVRSMDELVSLSAARQRFNMLLMTAFGCAALLLAAVGVYGLMAYSVEQRRREIGIRLALGAAGKQVRSAVVRRGMGLALAGSAIGVAAAFALTRFLASFLFGVQPRDPLVFAAAPLILTATAFLAVWLPANRASRIDPIEALRDE